MKHMPKLPLIFAAIALCAAAAAPSDAAQSVSGACKGTPVEPKKGSSAFVTSSSANPAADLREVEESVRLMEEKLKNNRYESMLRAEHAKVQEFEAARCKELKNEIWVLRDNLDALTADRDKLAAEKKKTEADLAEKIKASDDLEAKSKALTAATKLKEEEFKNASNSAGEKSDERLARLDVMKKDLKELNDKIAPLRSEKSKIDNDLSSKDVEYKAQVEKLNSVRDKLASAKEPSPIDKAEETRLKKSVDAIMAMAQGWEAASRKLSEEILSYSKKSKELEDSISLLEDESLAEAKELKSRLDALEKFKKENSSRAVKLRKDALKAKAKLMDARAADDKLAGEIKALEDKMAGVKAGLDTKVEEFKTRISVLLAQDDRDTAMRELERKRESAEKTAKPSSKGAELSGEIEEMMDTVMDENARLKSEKKAVEARLKRAEYDVLSARRRADQAAKAPKERKVKINRERVDMHYNLAVTYEKNGLYRDAEREYLKCLKIDPKDAGVHYNLGILYDDKLNRNKKAMQHYYKFLELRPMGDTAERVRDWITKLELENRLGKEMR